MPTKATASANRQTARTWRNGSWGGSMITSVRRNTALFALASLAIFAFAVAFFRSAIYSAHPDVVAWGLTFDLTLTVPLLYLLIVVRGMPISVATVAPVF